MLHYCDYLSDVKLLHCCKTGKLEELFIRCKIVAFLHCCIFPKMADLKLFRLISNIRIVGMLHYCDYLSDVKLLHCCKTGKLEELFIRCKIVALLHCCIFPKMADLKLFLRCKIVALLQDWET